MSLYEIVHNKVHKKEQISDENQVFVYKQLNSEKNDFYEINIKQISYEESAAIAIFLTNMNNTVKMMQLENKILE